MAHPVTNISVLTTEFHFGDVMGKLASCGAIVQEVERMEPEKLIVAAKIPCESYFEFSIYLAEVTKGDAVAKIVT